MKERGCIVSQLSIAFLLKFLSQILIVLLRKTVVCSFLFLFLEYSSIFYLEIPQLLPVMAEIVIFVFINYYRHVLIFIIFSGLQIRFIKTSFRIYSALLAIIGTSLKQEVIEN